MSMRVRYGTHGPLEQAADELLRSSLLGVKSRAEKSDILTPWKEANRRSVEVYVASGFPDPSLRQGLFRREANKTKPYMNSCDGVVGAHRSMVDSAVESSFAANEEY
jgi:hypothetical protein